MNCKDTGQEHDFIKVITHRLKYRQWVKCSIREYDELL